MVILKSKISKFLLALFTVIFFLSCQKNLDFVSIDGQSPDLITKVTSSVSGFVTDENNGPVLGATVKAGNFTATTDKYGFFEIRNAQVVKNAAVVTVSQPGYFKGIKTYTAVDNKSAFFRIKLIPKTNAGTINATTGGNVTLSNGLIVALPANGVVVASGGAAYTGTVNVAAHWIDPTAADLNQTMPGDLRGIATDGSLKSLTTYGMAAVELTGASGELLQIAPDKKATLTLNIPAAIASTAPATIPLWSFDESNGLWKQEGTAAKTGNTYVGEVSHFSFWNCDVPGNFVQLDCTIKDGDGNPLPYTLVRVSVVSAPYMARYGYTDSSGYVAGAVPDNSQLLLEVFTNYTCNSAVYSQTFTTTSSNLSLGVITIPSTTLGTATVTGTVTDCTNNPVTNGYLLVQENGFFSRYDLSNTGAFNFSRLLCNNSATVTIFAEDLGASQQSTPITQTLVPGANAIGNLQACGVSIAQFINYTVNGGATISMTAPADSVGHTGNGSALSNIIYGNQAGNISNINFAFDNANIGAGSTQILQNFYATQVGQGTSIVTANVVNITEYGPVGQFIAGNFTVNLIDTSTSTTYTVVCSFRVRRNF